MEVTMESLTHKKMERLKLWAGLWTFFMAFIVAPALFCTSAIEGESFATSVELVGSMLHSFGAPNFLASTLQLPVTMVAKILPVSTSTLIMPLLFLPFTWLAVVVPMLICGYVELPFYREMKTKIDPDWQIKENEGVIVKAKVSGYPFSIFVTLLMITCLISVFFIMPSIRTPIADNWSGEVYISDSQGRLTPIDAKLDIRIYDPGYVTDRKPYVSTSSLYIEFSGNGIGKLKALGINDNFIEGRQTDHIYYPSRLCEIDKANAQKDRKPYGISLPYFIKNYFLHTSDNEFLGGYSNLGCPKVMHFGISDFNNAQFAINGPTDNHYLVAKLKRDSRWNWIERLMIGNKFIKNPEETLEHSALGAPFGYR
ncbi:hypothetical protein V0M98_33115 (plasmid) [Pseudomonas silesiensis]|uniref:hypothetical protein n=1 Tax=Pseudomonas silesiensis TaxID=1853130 RepID=UPI0030CCEF9B